MEGLRSSVGVAASPFTKGPYTWDQTLSFNITGLPAGDSYSGFKSIVSAVNSSNAYGIAAYFEADISGTQAGSFAYVSGSWANVLTGTVGAGKYLCAQDNGIYEEAGATITNAKIIFGLRAEAIIADVDGLVFPFSINTNNTAITALIDVNNISDLGSATGKTTTSKFAPYARDANGSIVYVELFS